MAVRAGAVSPTTLAAMAAAEYPDLEKRCAALQSTVMHIDYLMKCVHGFDQGLDDGLIKNAKVCQSVYDQSHEMLNDLTEIEETVRLAAAHIRGRAKAVQERSSKALAAFRQVHASAAFSEGSDEEPGRSIRPVLSSSISSSSSSSSSSSTSHLAGALTVASRAVSSSLSSGVSSSASRTPAPAPVRGADAPAPSPVPAAAPSQAPAAPITMSSSLLSSVSPTSIFAPPPTSIARSSPLPTAGTDPLHSDEVAESRRAAPVAQSSSRNPLENVHFNHCDSERLFESLLASIPSSKQITIVTIERNHNLQRVLEDSISESVNKGDHAIIFELQLKPRNPEGIGTACRNAVVTTRRQGLFIYFTLPKDVDFVIFNTIAKKLQGAKITGGATEYHPPYSHRTSRPPTQAAAYPGAATAAPDPRQSRHARAPSPTRGSSASEQTMRDPRSKPVSQPFSLSSPPHTHSRAVTPATAAPADASGTTAIIAQIGAELTRYRSSSSVQAASMGGSSSRAAAPSSLSSPSPDMRQFSGSFSPPRPPSGGRTSDMRSTIAPPSTGVTATAHTPAAPAQTVRVPSQSSTRR